EGGVTVRTLKPFAHEVSVILPEGGAVAMEHEHDGIWVAALDRPSLPSYRIRVTWSAQAQPVELEEPYRFLPTVGEFGLHLIGEGRHEELWGAGRPCAHRRRRGGPLLRRLGAERPGRAGGGEL